MLAGPFALLVVDTAAAYFHGKDENDNVQAGSFARLLRSLTQQIPGGPTGFISTHPTKNAAPENLLPRGGGAFLNEMDGNLTCVKRELISEVHWLGKFRGPDFAPFSFLIQARDDRPIEGQQGEVDLDRYRPPDGIAGTRHRGRRPTPVMRTGC